MDPTQDQVQAQAQANQGNGHDATPEVPLKRKRGRPRKDQSGTRSGSARVPPAIKAVNETPRNLHSQMNRVDDENDGMVGQAVTGVIEVAFDAGYLLTVRIGNSNTCLRGIVFKPGHYVPISAENDIAPRVEMIRRNNNNNNTHFSPENKHTRVRSSREKNEKYETALALSVNGPPHRGGSKGKHLTPVAAPGLRGTVVPVILQPASLANGSPSPVNLTPPSATHMVPSKGKQAVPDERAQLGSRLMESRMENSTPTRELSAAAVDSDHLNSGPLLIKPLQAIHSNAHNLITPKVMEKSRTGRMTELLLAVQENMANNQETRKMNSVSEAARRDEETTADRR